MSLQQPIIQVDNLVKRYDKVLSLNHFNLEVKEGEILGLLGPNGCGKTTLINCILSLLKYDSGSITVYGQTLHPNDHQLKRRIGIVPQEIADFEELTVYENIDFFCGLYESDANKRRQLVQEAMDFVEIDKYQKYLPKKLSGGLKRRLNIACGIAHQPELLFMDEPTVAVDAQSRNFILEGIKRLKAKGITIVYTTHYLDEVEELCDRIVIMDSGQNVAAGSLEQLQKQVSKGEVINLELVTISDEAKQALMNLPFLNRLEELSDNHFNLHFGQGHNNLTQVVHFLDQHQLAYVQLFSQPISLNDIFLELTGKELRD
ncbi:ABC transporter ATP-binding protein [Vaginisenegalia massiliensis]|uniref:ABC transporter ATP-binding protein n=1 Tax=Vaginisenegalia massiliensis TaxID=2058294 RepID=UPI000F5492A8|nr:ABC transporter ATP-binding protein [Vaginisenegalia massiliensis]